MYHFSPAYSEYDNPLGDLEDHPTKHFNYDTNEGLLQEVILTKSANDTNIISPIYTEYDLEFGDGEFHPDTNFNYDKNTGLLQEVFLTKSLNDTDIITEPKIDTLVSSAKTNKLCLFLLYVIFLCLVTLNL